MRTRNREELAERRERLAAMAMQSLITSPRGIMDTNGSLPKIVGPELVALRAVQLADAILVELQRTEKK